MSITEMILNFIENAYKTQPEGFSGVDAKTLAAELGIWPNNVSAALKELVRGGSLRAEGSRPTRYFPAIREGTVQAADDAPAFQNIIGYDGSLKQQLELARVAASYPPHGIHTLITGETGVGKSLLAEEMWHYIQQLNPQKEIPYVVFNCAEYAENPQLLLSQLFGYEKGAFTGAESSHAGLVERADGGVLFLDELHRLPATGQEMLFTLIDKKLFRRMGSTTDRSVDLMIIGATTEDPGQSFLKTFIRRIPILIQLPTLNERPLEERADLVNLFLSREANRMGMAIRVSTNALKLMVSFQSETNIGELRNEIQLCCARSFLLYKSTPEKSSGDVPFIIITSRCLSRKMNSGASLDKHSQGESYPKNELIIYPDHAPDKFSASAGSKPLDFYRFVEDRMLAYRTSQHSSDEVSQLVALDLEKQYRNTLKEQSYYKLVEGNRIFSSVPADIWAAANELIRLATTEFNRTYSDNTLYTLATYLNQTKAYAMANQVIFDDSINSCLEPNYAEREFIRKTMPILKAVLGTELTDGEIGILAMLLRQDEQPDSTPHIGLVVCMYGNGTASGTAAFANEVLLADLVSGLDLPLDQPIEISLQKLYAIIDRQDQGLGVIVLTDNDSLIALENKIHEQTKAQCRILPWSGVALTLEIAKAIQTQNCSLDVLVENTITAYCKYLDSLFRRINQRNYVINPEPPVQRGVVITYCLTGTGSARHARDLLLKSPVILASFEVIAMGVHDNIKAAATKYGDRLKLIIGLLSPQIPNVPYVSMESIASPGGINRVLLLLQGMQTLTNEPPFYRRNQSLNSRLSQIATKMSYFAPSLDASLVEQQALEVIGQLSRLYREKLPDDVLVRVFIHTATMFERIRSGDAIHAQYNMRVDDRYHNFLELLHEILENACRPFNCSVPLSEVYFFIITVPDPDTMGEIHLEMDHELR